MGSETDLIQTALLGEAASFAPLGIFVAGEDLSCLVVNHYGRALLGYGRDELSKLNPLDVSIRAPADFEALHRQLLAAGRLDSRARLRRKDGHEIEVEYSSLATRVGGRRVFVSFIWPDHGTLPRLDPADVERSPEEATLLGEAAEHAPIGMLVADETMRLLAVNRHACELFGYERERLLERRVADVSPPPRSQELYDEMVSRSSLGGVTEGLHRDGTRFPIRYEAVKTTMAGMPVYTSFVRPLEPDHGGNRGSPAGAPSPG